MLVSIITVTYNSEATILDTLNSVLCQTYKKIEHIIVDGKSTDKTYEILRKYPKKNKILISKKDSGAYEAMNRGIKIAKGEIITILNSDDIYNSPKIIEKVIKKIKKNPKTDFFFGDVSYFKNYNYEKIKRVYSSKDFKTKDLFKGNMPPHPATFVRRKIYEKYGYYDQNYKIASDYNFLLKIAVKSKINFLNMNIRVAKMRLGGLSTKNIFSYITTTNEIRKTMRELNIKFSLLNSIRRIPSKIQQLFVSYKTMTLWNYEFKKIYSKFYINNYDNYFQIIKNPKKILLSGNKKFILTAMNLAFLGFYSKNLIKNNRYFLCWPDGVFFTKNIMNNKIKKTPGRDIVKGITLPKNITNITILGNLHEKSKKYLEKKYKVKINHYDLDYGPINHIYKNLKFKPKANSLIFITLPTPKQEQLASLIFKNNNQAKIICIGGSVAIAAGVEKPVPKILSQIEFFWRLRYETKRRILRLWLSFFYYLYGKYIRKIINQLDFNVIK